MMQLLKMSITGSVMILVIALLRVLFQNKLHRSVILSLWFLAVLRLTVPLFPKSAASIYNVLPQQAPTTLTVTQSVVVTPSSGAPIVYTEAPALSWQELLQTVWLLGCVACVLFFAVMHIQARLRYRFAIPEEAPPYMGRLRLRRLEGLPSPLVYGLLRPTVLLPSGFPQKDSEEYEHVLRHEMRHVRNGDLWYKFLLLLVTSLHWFNPFVWLMLYLASQDMEMRCDAQVVKELGAKKAYAQTLVHAEVSQLNHLVQTCFAFCATGRRIRALARAKTHIVRSVLVCVIVATLLLTCFATARNSSEPSPTQDEEPLPVPQTTAPSTAVPSTSTEPPTQTTQPTMESSSETEAATEPSTESQPTEMSAETEANTPTEETAQSTTGTAPFALGNHTILAAETKNYILDMNHSKYDIFTDNPECVDIQVGRRYDGDYDFIVRGYEIGTANIYATNSAVTYWVASFTVCPNGETEDQTFAEMENAETPTVTISDFTAPIP